MIAAELGRHTGSVRRMARTMGDIVEEVAAAPRRRRISSKDQKARDATHLAFGQRESFCHLAYPQSYGHCASAIFWHLLQIEFDDELIFSRGPH